MLVKAGANAKIADNQKSTPLHIAAETGFLPTVVYLITDGLAGVNAPNSRGKVPLHYLATTTRDKSIISHFVQVSTFLFDLKALWLIPYELL